MLGPGEPPGAHQHGVVLPAPLASPVRGRPELSEAQQELARMVALKEQTNQSTNGRGDENRAVQSPMVIFYVIQALQV